VADLLAHPRATARVEGFADSTGSPSANKVLSQRRADAVAKEIAKGNASSTWLFAVGRGVLRTSTTKHATAAS
jgi:outer membrane protein OmpA-like peptidoglycan-associated protein